MAPKNDDYDFEIPPEEEVVPVVQPLGLNVAVRYGNKYLLKDMAYLTGEEVLEWVKQVLPATDFSKLKPSDFESRTAKAQAFDQVLKFHATTIFPKPSEMVEKTKKK